VRLAAAEWLRAHESPDHIAVDVNIAVGERCDNMRHRGVDARMNAEREGLAKMSQLLCDPAAPLASKAARGGLRFRNGGKHPQGETGCPTKRQRRVMHAGRSRRTAWRFIVAKFLASKFLLPSFCRQIFVAKPIFFA
jgi:hypothetical protein